MGGADEYLMRIADALDRLAPAGAKTVDWDAAPGFVWDGSSARPVPQLAALPLGSLRGIDRQKSAVRANVERLANRNAAHDMLLWGARGMGKSALVRAAVAQVQQQNPGNLVLIQLPSDGLPSLAGLIEMLAGQDAAFLLFIDDLGFGAEQAQSVLALRSLLDGGVMPRPAHVRVAVTANRRAIVARDQHESEAMHERDERDNALALADRFGLTLGFHPCDRDTFLDILRAYTDPAGLTFDEEEALAWAIARGNRSGRSAQQFAVELAGRAGKAL